MEAGLIIILLLGGGVALSLGLAYGVLRVTVHAMAAAAVPTTSGTQLTATGLVSLR